MNQPLITIAILSWNRLHYLRATLESAKECIQYPNIEWIVSDNESEEPGLRSYIEKQDWIQQKIFRKQSHADAMNELVNRACGKYILIWPEDVQFVVAGEWMSHLVSLLEAHPFIGSVGLDALRRKTIQQFLQSFSVQDFASVLRELYWYRHNFRRQHVLRGEGGILVYTLGFRCAGICGSGIPTLTRTNVWRELGPWKTCEEFSTGLVDSSGGAEIDMYRRFHLSKLPLQSAIMHVPVAADILTDPLGCKAKVRKGVRYGVYMPPQEDSFYYYQIRHQSEFPVTGQSFPYSFTDVVSPIGFRLPLGSDNERLKYPINTSVAFDIGRDQPVTYPLVD